MYIASYIYIIYGAVIYFYFFSYQTGPYISGVVVVPGTVSYNLPGVCCLFFGKIPNGASLPSRTRGPGLVVHARAACSPCAVVKFNGKP